MNKLYDNLLEGLLIIDDKKLVATSVKGQIIRQLKDSLEKDTQNKKYAIETYGIKVVRKKHKLDEITHWKKVRGFSLWEIFDLPEESQEHPQQPIVSKPLQPWRRNNDEED